MEPFYNSFGANSGWGKRTAIADTRPFGLSLVVFRGDMGRLLIIGSSAFTVDAMHFAAIYGAGMNVLAVVDQGVDVSEEIARTRPDVIILDGLADPSRAFEMVRRFRVDAAAALVVIVVDDLNAADTGPELDAGTVLCARPAIIRRSVQNVQSDKARPVRAVSGSTGARVGHAALTGRELETLRWVAEAHTNGWIARRLWVTEQTVKFHLTNIYRKLGVSNRTEASHYAIQHGLVPGFRDSDKAPDVDQGGDFGPDTGAEVAGARQ